MGKIKIIATIGPSSLDEKTIKKMDSAGVDYFRINLSHTSVEDFIPMVNKIKGWTNKPICPDTEGAQIRCSILSDVIKVKSHEIVEFVNKSNLVDETQIGITGGHVSKLFRKGDLVKIDFDGVLIHIIGISRKKLIGRVISGGIIGNNKGLSCDRIIDIPSFSNKDEQIIEISKNLGLNNIFLSFCSRGKNVLSLREKFDYEINVISKIESKLGLQNLKNICRRSDAILIDRGDLSRDVPLEKIPFAQKYILDEARTVNTPVYVATNLMDNMIIKSKPTRAEVNDIRSTLNEGATGLVLAAETAIGKYPVDCVRIMSTIISEASNNKNHHILDNLFNLPMNRIIEPHGGKIINQFVDKVDKNDLLELFVDDGIFMDSNQIANGTYSPVSSFMNLEEVNFILQKNQWRNGAVWTLPIIFQIDKETAQLIPSNRSVLLKRKNEEEPFALLKINKVEKLIEKNKIANLWFGTDNVKHPGVSRFFSNGDYIVSGSPFLINNYTYPSRNKYELTPTQTRNIIDHCGWHNIIGFHTRNIVHRGHEYIQLKSLEEYNADAIFISPVTGIKKKGDFTEKVIFDCYEELIRNKIYEPYGVLLAAFNTHSRYSGPREAVFTAICRKNFGCSHFIVGRDHTGVGSFYKNTSSQDIFDKLDLGINIIKVDEVVYNTKENKLIFNKNRESHSENIKEISGTAIRDRLKSNVNLPDYLVRSNISRILKNLYNDNCKELFVGE